jgi:hypothetical protein
MPRVWLELTVVIHFFCCFTAGARTLIVNLAHQAAAAAAPRAGRQHICGYLPVAWEGLRST